MSAADAFLTPARARANLGVFTGAHANRILFEGRRVVGVELSVGNKTKRLVARRETLICAGAFETPK